MSNESNEVARMVALAERMIEGGDADPQTAVSDAIANLLILAHEQDLDVAGAWYRGAAHYCATYIEPLTSEDAADWLQDHLFPFSGEESADHYIGGDACVLAGKSRDIQPEFGE
jgi:hypothetical protein